MSVCDEVTNTSMYVMLQLQTGYKLYGKKEVM